jgi:hypothetical protein
VSFVVKKFITTKSTKVTKFSSGRCAFRIFSARVLSSEINEFMRRSVRLRRSLSRLETISTHRITRGPSRRAAVLQFLQHSLELSKVSMSMGMDISGRKARGHPKLLPEGISLRLPDLSVGNFLPLATICFSFCAGSQPGRIYPPSQKTTAVRPWMNARGGPSEARRAKEGASADFAEELRKIPRA